MMRNSFFPGFLSILAVVIIVLGLLLMAGVAPAFQDADGDGISDAWEWTESFGRAQDELLTTEYLRFYWRADRFAGVGIDLGGVRPVLAAANLDNAVDLLASHAAFLATLDDIVAEEGDRLDLISRVALLRLRIEGKWLMAHLAMLRDSRHDELDRALAGIQPRELLATAGSYIPASSFDIEEYASSLIRSYSWQVRDLLIADGYIISPSYRLMID
jgi:hypothetical protein